MTNRTTPGPTGSTVPQHAPQATGGAPTGQPRSGGFPPSTLAPRIRQDHRLHLLPAQALVKTGEIDHADWNYRPYLGWIQKLRFRLICSLMPKRRVPRLLEIGYGSGIFMPELALRCDELYGIDVHTKPAEVTAQLSSFGIGARLSTASAEALPFDDHYFDLMVAVSSLEFIPQIDLASREMCRTLQPGGRLIIVTPGHSLILDVGLKLMTGESAKKDYGHRRERLLAGLNSQFRVCTTRSVPPLLGSKGLYCAMVLSKLQAPASLPSPSP